MNLIAPYFITLTRAEEGPLLGVPYDVNPHFVILKAPSKDGGSAVIINALVYYGDAPPGLRMGHLEIRVRETPAEIQAMIDAVHQRATGTFLDFQAMASKAMQKQTEKLERSGKRWWNIFMPNE